MRYGLLTSAAVAALSLSIAAYAQGTGGASGGGNTGGSGSSMSGAPPATGGAGAGPSGGSAGGSSSMSGAGSGGAAGTTAGSSGRASGSTSGTAQSGTGGAAGSSSGQASGTSAGTSGGAAATTGSVPNITTEQRTQITQTFHSVSVPTANVNITSVSVGTVLPADVTLVDVPAEIIRIVPAWRTYKVVKIRNQIVVVEPGTRRIVYVLSA